MPSRLFLGFASPVVLAACLGIASCASENQIDEGVGGNAHQQTGTGSVTPEGVVATVEVVPLDIWARPLPDSVLTVELDGQAVSPTEVQGAFEVFLTKAANVSIGLTAADHQPLQVALAFDGTGESSGLSLAGEPPSESAIAISHREVGGVMRHVVHLGLAHDWYSSQARPPRRGNLIELHTSGETAWAALRKDLDAAKENILISTWWWQSDFELTRTNELLTPGERWNNTILGVLEKSTAKKRVLVGQFLDQDGLFSSVTWDSGLSDHGPVPNDQFEVMGQANPSSGKFWFEPTPIDFTARVVERVPGASGAEFDAFPPIDSVVPAREVDLTAWPIELDVNHGSYHQKFAVLDDGLAYVGGMNLKEVDWDTDEHRVFEPLRMVFDASDGERVAVATKASLPDNLPRKDYMLRIEGPAAQDVADVFQRRWQHQLDSDVTYAAFNTPFEVERDVAEIPEGLEVQITTTMPNPFWEHGIAETWLKAVARAERFLFIEDQYFRAPMLNAVIEKRMTEKPELVLVVVTRPVGEWADPGCAWTYQSDTLFASKFPGRYLPLRLRAFDVAISDGPLVWDETDAYFVDVDVHSKMLIVDDRFMSVGSANKNNRGMVYEAEMNAAIANPTWVTQQRRRILEQLLPKGAVVSDDPKVWFAALGAAAGANAKVYQAWTDAGFDLDLDGAPVPPAYVPKGLVYPQEFGSLADCLFESVGPDLTSQGH